MVIRIIGTGHVLKKSVSEVKEKIEGARPAPNIVALELDSARFSALLERRRQEKEGKPGKQKNEGIISFLRGGGGSLPLFANFLLGKILSSIQESFGARFGVFPGAEMAQAIDSAQYVSAKIALIDRDVQITLNRLLSIPFSEKIRLLSVSGIDKEKFSGIKDINDILKEEVVSELMDELKKKTPSLHSALVDERDKIMARALFDIKEKSPGSEIVAVLGAGHKKGVKHYLSILETGGEIFTARYEKMKKVGILQTFFFIFIVLVGFIILEIQFLINKIIKRK